MLEAESEKNFKSRKAYEEVPHLLCRYKGTRFMLCKYTGSVGRCQEWSTFWKQVTVCRGESIVTSCRIWKLSSRSPVKLKCSSKGLCQTNIAEVSRDERTSSFPSQRKQDGKGAKERRRRIPKDASWCSSGKNASQHCLLLRSVDYLPQSS